GFFEEEVHGAIGSQQPLAARRQRETHGAIGGGFEGGGALAVAAQEDEAAGLHVLRGRMIGRTGLAHDEYERSGEDDDKEGGAQGGDLSAHHRELVGDVVGFDVSAIHGVLLILAHAPGGGAWMRASIAPAIDDGKSSGPTSTQRACGNLRYHVR